MVLLSAVSRSLCFLSLIHLTIWWLPWTAPVQCHVEYSGRSFVCRFKPICTSLCCFFSGFSGLLTVWTSNWQINGSGPAVVLKLKKAMSHKAIYWQPVLGNLQTEQVFTKWKFIWFSGDHKTLFEKFLMCHLSCPVACTAVICKGNLFDGSLIIPLLGQYQNAAVPACFPNNLIILYSIGNCLNNCWHKNLLVSDQRRAVGIKTYLLAIKGELLLV